MKILVTGAKGQLGYDICRVLTREGKHEAIGIDIGELDITDECAVHMYIETLRPDVVMHNAAYTAVDKAEIDEAACRGVNAFGTKYLAEAAASVGAKFLYISTDYVFDGEKEGAYLPDDPLSPVSVYGRTKAEGEAYVRAASDRFFIVRISWVFGINGNNFVRTMLRLYETKPELNVVCDQIGSPTYTADLAELLCVMIETERFGTYHATNEGVCSWYEFAREIMRLAGRETVINAVTTEEYLKIAPQQAKRPMNSVLSQDTLEQNGFIRLPHWKDAVKRYLDELKGKGAQ